MLSGGDEAAVNMTDLSEKSFFFLNDRFLSVFVPVH